MTILPLIQKQRWGKMFGRRTAWDCLQQNYTARECPAKPHPTPTWQEEGNQLTTPGSAPLLLHFPLTHAHSHAAPVLVPDATCSSHHPRPLHSHPCGNVCPSLPSDVIFPSRPCQRPPRHVAVFHWRPLTHVPASDTRLHWCPRCSVGQPETPTGRPCCEPGGGLLGNLWLNNIN